MKLSGTTIITAIAWEVDGGRKIGEGSLRKDVEEHSGMLIVFVNSQTLHSRHYPVSSRESNSSSFKGERKQ